MDAQRSSVALSRQQQANINSHIYASFAGANGTRNTNGTLTDFPTMWWDEERIEATVTREFVVSNLRPDEQERLDEPLGFGDGLTDDTYWEWIESKAKRIFLILVDLDVSDQIFGVIDDSWDDDDLPVPLDQVERLQLTYDRDEKLERKFFQRQFNYLLRNIQKGEQVSYADEEVVPLELAEKRPVGAITGLNQSYIDKVHLPGRPDTIFMRRRIPLGVSPGRMPQEEFLSGVETMKVIDHDHLTSLWASYIHQECGYLLLTPVNDNTLKSFLTITPQSVKILAKQDRRILLLNWIHCLADALCFLHRQGLSHRNIKPSNIMLDFDNHIFLGDTGIFPTTTSTGEKRAFDKESYDFSAPEEAQRPQVYAPILLHVSRPATSRRGGSRNSSSYPSTPTSPIFKDSASVHTVTNVSNTPTSQSTSDGTGGKHDPQKSDIFSLGTIFLEILTFLLKRASRNFSSHRSVKNKTPGRGGGLPDSSFHKNLAQVESWMAILAKDASKKEDKLFRGVTHILSLVEKMLSPYPEDRPSAAYIQEKIYTILTQNSGFGAATEGVQDGERGGRMHCGSPQVEPSEFNFGFDELRLASQRAAAMACANVNPTATVFTQRSLGNGGIINGVERVESHISIRSPEGDRMSIATKTSKSSEGKSRVGSGTGSASVSGVGGGKAKPKAKAWQAPVYAEMSFG